ncbi:MAG: Gldg family protein [Clostridiales bacterium]|nr:Gldg family protein [Clostridiales bacterium]
MKELEKEKQNKNSNKSSERVKNVDNSFKNRVSKLKNCLSRGKEKLNKFLGIDKMKRYTTFNMFKNGYTYLIMGILIITSLIYVHRNAISTKTGGGLISLENPFMVLYSLLMFVLPIVALFSYSEKDLELREKAKKENKVLKYTISKFIEIFVFTISVSVLTFLGTFIYKYNNAFELKYNILPFIGVLFASITYTASVIISYEFIQEKKMIAISPLIAIAIIGLPNFIIQIVAKNADFLTIMNIGIFLLEVITLTRLIIFAVYTAILLIIVFLIAKNNQRKYKEKVNEKNNLKSKILRLTNKRNVQFILIILTIISALLFAYLNIYFGNKFKDRIDFNSDKKYTLTKELKNFIKNDLKEELILAYKGENSNSIYIKSIQEQIEKINNKVKFIVLNQEDTKERIKDGITEGIYIIKVNSEKNTSNRYVIDLKKYATIAGTKENELNSLLESEILEGLKIMSLDQKKLEIGFLNLFDNTINFRMNGLKTIIVNKGMKYTEFKSLNKEELNKVSTLIIPLLPRDITEEEKKLLEEFKENGGNIISFRPSGEEGKLASTPVLDTFMAEYGVKVNNREFVLEFDDKRRNVSLKQLTDEEVKEEEKKTGEKKAVKTVYDNRMMYVDMVSNTRITEYLEAARLEAPARTVLTGRVQKLDNVDGDKIKYTPIYQTSKKARVTTEKEKDTEKEKSDKGIEGMYDVLSLSEVKVKDGKVSKLITIPSIMMFTDTKYPNIAEGQVELSKLRSVEYLVSGMINELINPNGEVKTKKETLNVYVPYLNQEEMKDRKYEEIAKNKVKTKEKLIFAYGSIFIIISIVVFYKSFTSKENKEK